MGRLSRVVLSLVVSAGLLLAYAPQSYAQSNALSITPRLDYTLKPGETVSDNLNVTNTNNDVPLTLQVRIIDFSASNQTGTPKLNRDTTAEPTPWSLREFIQIPEQVTLERGKTTTVPITISMPADVGAGSYYSAIEYAAVPNIEQDRVNIAASGVSLVFVSVPGVTKQQLKFEKFGAVRLDGEEVTSNFAGLFFNNQPRVLAYRLKNEGNVAENPRAVIVVRDFSGKEVRTISNANPKNQIALRGQARQFDTCINGVPEKNASAGGAEVETIACKDPGLAPGRYSAELTILYGENGNDTQEITAVAAFWYLPVWFIGLVLTGLAIAAGAGFWIWRQYQDRMSRKTRRR